MAVSIEQQCALQFAQMLAHQMYDAAYAMTTPQYRQQTSRGQMQAYFEHTIPTDWGIIDPIEVVGDTLTDFPDRQPTDVGWVYVSLEGTEYPYSEGLYILVTRDEDALRVQAVVFGRP